MVCFTKYIPQDFQVSYNVPCPITKLSNSKVRQVLQSESGNFPWCGYIKFPSFVHTNTKSVLISHILCGCGLFVISVYTKDLVHSAVHTMDWITIDLLQAIDVRLA